LGLGVIYLTEEWSIVCRLRLKIVKLSFDKRLMMRDYEVNILKSSWMIWWNYISTKWPTSSRFVLHYSLLYFYCLRLASSTNIFHFSMPLLASSSCSFGVSSCLVFPLFDVCFILHNF